MLILSNKLFENELEYFEMLKHGEGYISERLILHCDKWRLNNQPEVTADMLDSTVNFVTNVFKDFALDVSSEDKVNIYNHFFNTRPNYYSIKQFIIDEINKILGEP